MTKILTDRQVVQLHQMHQAGATNQQIASTLQVNRNTISAHLAGDVVYPDHIYRKIGKSARLVASERMTLREAAPWIPGHPSPSRMRILVRGVSWSGQKCRRLKTRLHRGRRVTSIKWIRNFVAADYPPGIWITDQTADAICPDLEIDEFQLIGRDPAQAPHASCFHAVPLPALYRIAEQQGLPLTPGPLLVHKAARLCEHIGTAVL